MNSTPKVAVVLINRNGYDLTEACVHSLVKTGYANLLTVIVDNGSKAEDLERLARLAEREKTVLIHPLGYNAGFTKANNAGMEVSLERQADYIWILNNDTEVRQDAIDLHIKAFSTANLDPANTVLSSIITYWENDNIWCNGLRDMPFTNFPRSVDKMRPAAEVAKPGIELKAAEYGVGCSMFFAVEFVKVHGMMDEDYFIYYDDLDYTFGCKNLFIQQPLVKHKVSATSGFKGSARFTPFQSHLFAKNGIQFYFRKKKIPFYQKAIYIGFTQWVFAVLYIRDFATFKAHLRGMREGLFGSKPQAG